MTDHGLDATRATLLRNPTVESALAYYEEMRKTFGWPYPKDASPENTALCMVHKARLVWPGSTKKTDLTPAEIEEYEIWANNARDARKLTNRKLLNEVTVESEHLLALCAMARAKIAAEERVRELERTAAFVYLWATREGLSDAERLSVIKHRPGWDRFVNGAEPSDELTEARARASRVEQERDRLAEAVRLLNEACEAVLGQYVLDGGVGEVVDAAMDNAARVLASLSAEKEAPVDAALSEEPGT